MVFKCIGRECKWLHCSFIKSDEIKLCGVRITRRRTAMNWLWSMDGVQSLNLHKPENFNWLRVQKVLWHGTAISHVRQSVVKLSLNVHDILSELWMQPKWGLSLFIRMDGLTNSRPALVTVTCWWIIREGVIRQHRNDWRKKDVRLQLEGNVGGNYKFKCASLLSNWVIV